MAVLGWGRELRSNTDEMVLSGCKHHLCPLFSQTVLRCRSPFPLLCFPLILPSVRVSPTLCKERTAILRLFPCISEGSAQRGSHDATRWQHHSMDGFQAPGTAAKAMLPSLIQFQQHLI